MIASLILLLGFSLSLLGCAAVNFIILTARRIRILEAKVLAMSSHLGLDIEVEIDGDSISTTLRDRNEGHDD